ncbi:hypothetical protein JCM33374_g37 [Metschnikowia sp. JCM 33374]|nr:hypothetical protein JCM33374_g37 [Metschnikowia sp. JCM 33374]
MQIQKASNISFNGEFNFLRIADSKMTQIQAEIAAQEPLDAPTPPQYTNLELRPARYNASTTRRHTRIARPVSVGDEYIITSFPTEADSSIDPPGLATTIPIATSLPNTRQHTGSNVPENAVVPDKHTFASGAHTHIPTSDTTVTMHDIGTTPTNPGSTNSPDVITLSIERMSNEQMASKTSEEMEADFSVYGPEVSKAFATNYNPTASIPVDDDKPNDSVHRLATRLSKRFLLPTKPVTEEETDTEMARVKVTIISSFEKQRSHLCSWHRVQRNGSRNTTPT